MHTERSGSAPNDVPNLSSACPNISRTNKSYSYTYSRTVPKSTCCNVTFARSKKRGSLKKAYPDLKGGIQSMPAGKKAEFARLGECRETFSAEYVHYITRVHPVGYHYHIGRTARKIQIEGLNSVNPSKSSGYRSECLRDLWQVAHTATPS